MTLSRFAATLVLGLSLTLLPVSAQTPAQLKQELDALKQRVDAQQKEIEALKASRPAAPAPVNLDSIVLKLDKAPMKGSASARVVLVEISDFECPFCSRHVRQTSPQIEKAYVEAGKIRHAFVNLPLASHRNAFKAAEAGLCAADQGKFWDMHARMFANQTQLAAPLLPALATSAGVNADQLRTCVESGKKREQVSSDLAMVSLIRFGGRFSYAA